MSMTAPPACILLYCISALYVVLHRDMLHCSVQKGRTAWNTLTQAAACPDVELLYLSEGCFTNPNLPESRVTGVLGVL